jgi:glycosyltransferase involved in cell wall biosynthesis
MRILVVTNLYPPVALGGYEACCQLVVDRLRERHDVRVLTSDQRAHAVPPESWIWRRLPLFSGISGDTLTAAPVTRRAIREARRALDRFAPEFVFVWGGSGIPKGAIRVLETAGVPLAFSVLDYWFDRPYDTDPFVRYLLGRETGMRAVWSALMRAGNRLPSLRVDDLSRVTPAAVCWCSEATRGLTSVSATVEPVLEQTIPLATNHETALSNLQREPGDRPTIAFVGRVTVEKGPHVAVRAVHALAREHGIDADLVLCGNADPAIAAELEELGRELGICDRVRLLGALGPDALAKVLASADVLIVPSIWQEPFGLVCLEGALARVPVVASRSGGMTEILTDEQHALFFPIGDALAAAAAIARVLTQPEDTSARVSRAFARAREFSVVRYVRESESFVDEAYDVLTSRESR